jgi:hypothetical protein
MKKNNVKLGAVYAVKVSGEIQPVRLDSTNPHGGFDGTNMRTKKSVRIVSTQRLRGLWPKKTLPIVADKADDKGVAATVAAVEKGNLAEGVTVPEAKKERHSLLNLAAKVLAEAGQPLNCKEMVEKVLATGLWQTDGKTPSATLYSAILRETKTKGDAARFRKTERGKFEIVTK